MQSKEENQQRISELASRFSHIKGWGIDADPLNEPTYPMKDYTGADHERLNYARPTNQVSSVEVLKSNERPVLSAVYGTTVPPRGISGNVRRYAFRSSENSYNHWLPLLFADRIDMLEGLWEDLKSGHIPNLFLEKGLRAEWKYNRPAFTRKLLIAGITIATLAALKYAKRSTARNA